MEGLANNNTNNESVAKPRPVFSISRSPDIWKYRARFGDGRLVGGGIIRRDGGGRKEGCGGESVCSLLLL